MDSNAFRQTRTWYLRMAEICFLMEDRPEMQKIPKLALIRFLALQLCIRMKAWIRQDIRIRAENCLEIRIM